MRSFWTCVLIITATVSFGQEVCSFQNKFLEEIILKYNQQYNLESNKASIEVCIYNPQLEIKEVTPGIVSGFFQDSLNWNQVFCLVKVWGSDYQFDIPQLVCHLDGKSNYVIFYSGLNKHLGPQTNFIGKKEFKLINKLGQIR